MDILFHYDDTTTLKLANLRSLFGTFSSPSHKRKLRANQEL